jgi:hypothetical protein
MVEKKPVILVTGANGFVYFLPWRLAFANAIAEGSGLVSVTVSSSNSPKTSLSMLLQRSRDHLWPPNRQNPPRMLLLLARR